MVGMRPSSVIIVCIFREFVDHSSYLLSTNDSHPAAASPEMSPASPEDKGCLLPLHSVTVTCGKFIMDTTLLSTGHSTSAVPRWLRE